MTETLMRETVPTPRKMTPLVSDFPGAEEVAQQGEHLYQTCIRSQVEAQHMGRVLGIDIDTGDYEIGEDSLEVADRLHAKNENAVVYILRIGAPFFGYL